MNLFEHHISTKNAQQMTKVTNMVREDVARSGVSYTLRIRQQGLRSMRTRIPMLCTICLPDSRKYFLWKRLFTVMRREIPMRI